MNIKYIYNDILTRTKMLSSQLTLDTLRNICIFKGKYLIDASQYFTSGSHGSFSASLASKNIAQRVGKHFTHFELYYHHSVIEVETGILLF